MEIFQLGVVFFGCLLIRIEAQNTSSPLDFINTMKTSLEAAGAGAIKLGPMGLLGDMNGQFGLKVNKEQTTSGTSSAIVGTVRNKRLLSALGTKDGKGYKSLIHGTKTSLSKEDPKNCYGRYGRQPIIIPIIVQSTTAATTTTTAAG
ncbi:uncharacterized protein LOC123676412 [Harmonia axyridis]|uniref:uncharacterized protein LOC123676412 n=1 Tax=Harmonia axyridis TaxID=115357 RepID=UPI001E27907B|nr:uncharacterized protein LOC123676412 [Harmonia axyridis]